MKTAKGKPDQPGMLVGEGKSGCRYTLSEGVSGTLVNCHVTRSCVLSRGGMYYFIMWIRHVTCDFVILHVHVTYEGEGLDS